MDDAPPEVLFPSFYLLSMCWNPTLYSTLCMILLDQHLGTVHKLSILLNVGLCIFRRDAEHKHNFSWKLSKECIVQL